MNSNMFGKPLQATICGESYSDAPVRRRISKGYRAMEELDAEYNWMQSRDMLF